MILKLLLPQISLNGTKNYCYSVFTSEDQLVAKKNARKIAAYCSHVMIIQFVVGEVIQIYTVL